MDPSYINQVQINLNNNKKNSSNDRKGNNYNNQHINSIISPPSEKKLVNNYLSEKNESSKSKGCICQTRPEEALIKNGICRLCDRQISRNNNNTNKNQNNNNHISYLDNVTKKPRTADYNSHNNKKNK